MPGWEQEPVAAALACHMLKKWLNLPMPRLWILFRFFQRLGIASLAALTPLLP